MLDENKTVLAKTGEMARVDAPFGNETYQIRITATSDQSGTDTTGYLKLKQVYVYNGDTQVTLTNPTASSTLTSYTADKAIDGEYQL